MYMAPLMRGLNGGPHLKEGRSSLARPVVSEWAIENQPVEKQQVTVLVRADGLIWDDQRKNLVDSNEKSKCVHSLVV